MRPGRRWIRLRRWRGGLQRFAKLLPESGIFLVVDDVFYVGKLCDAISAFSRRDEIGERARRVGCLESLTPGYRRSGIHELGVDFRLLRIGTWALHFPQNSG